MQNHKERNFTIDLSVFEMSILPNVPFLFSGESFLSYRRIKVSPVPKYSAKKAYRIRKGKAPRILDRGIR
jgi:hypothetical protein